MVLYLWETVTAPGPSVWKNEAEVKKRAGADWPPHPARQTLRNGPGMIIQGQGAIKMQINNWKYYATKEQLFEAAERLGLNHLLEVMKMSIVNTPKYKPEDHEWWVKVERERAILKSMFPEDQFFGIVEFLHVCKECEAPTGGSTSLCKKCKEKRKRQQSENERIRVSKKIFGPNPPDVIRFDYGENRKALCIMAEIAGYERQEDHVTYWEDGYDTATIIYKKEEVEND